MPEAVAIPFLQQPAANRIAIASAVAGRRRKRAAAEALMPFAKMRVAQGNPS
jgi:hypothetical protein